VTRYLKVHVEGCHVGCDADLYAALDHPEGEYKAGELEQWAQDLVNERHSWGYEVVDESDVPEGER